MKKTISIRSIILSIMMTVAWVGQAQAAGLSVVGALDYGLVNSGGVKGKLGFGGGLSRVFGLGSNGLEIGAIYLSRGYEAAGITSRAGVLHAPVLFRFGGMTSFGAGGYYDFGISNGALDQYGLAGSVRLSLAPKVFVDTRFLFDLKNSGTKYNSLMLWVGFEI